ncbi:N-hydroxyarylamine O-acetyltransferase [Sporomusaceae bacterium BoRhaA]|uniref:arylamine N-acetyltransferase family protein n=1 Tax=Pelorhabdus rhamnosifermentans TaxID=2772457 RepID=UPI001C063D66|nr:arylamine N-acetyltransferase [Pelorhabdus rhamnosifermentans]MBU2702721.1 N-hydroxyarylamine O-acetyltransferase [Pelorhabdus rhamnosifermentans]
MIYTKKQIEQYLERIQYGSWVAFNEQTLRDLQIAHLTHIPYENLDVLKGIPVSLDSEALFNKMILGKRGGYCFELNGLYSNLLKSLGFRVTNYLGRFIIGYNSVQMRRHRILKVATNDGVFICDVGVRSESYRAPLYFIEKKVQSDGISEYKLVRDDFYGWILCMRESGKDWKKIYGFTEEPQLDLDYVMPSFFCEKHPDSEHNKFRKISIFTANSQIGLVDNELKVYKNAKIDQKKRLQNEEEIHEVLRTVFGIENI